MDELKTSETTGGTEGLSAGTEATFRALLESAPDAIVIVNDKLEIIMVNEEFERLFGYDREEVIGKPVELLVPPQFGRHREYAGEFVKAPHRRRMGEGRELYGLRRDGTEFPVEISLSPLETTDGLIVYAAVRDMTERKRVEDEIRRLNTELEKIVAERTSQLLVAQEELVRREKLAFLGRLSGSIGNELRNPLGVMNNAVFYLESVLFTADEAVREYLEIIRLEIENSQRIINDLLDYSQTRIPRPEALAVGEFVGMILGRCTIPGNIEILVEIPDDLPDIFVDQQQIGRVLWNLFTNGVQAMPNGGTLRVYARRRGPGESPVSDLRSPVSDGNFIEISVTDTGEGISSENMKKLFQPLFTTRSRGIGLGLAVSKNYTEANGGRISVESEVGKGTTFTVILPAKGEG